MNGLPEDAAAGAGRQVGVCREEGVDPWEGPAVVLVRLRLVKRVAAAVDVDVSEGPRRRRLELCRLGQLRIQPPGAPAAW